MEVENIINTCAELFELFDFDSEIELEEPISLNSIDLI